MYFLFKSNHKHNLKINLLIMSDYATIEELEVAFDGMMMSESEDVVLIEVEAIEVEARTASTEIGAGTAFVGRASPNPNYVGEKFRKFFAGTYFSREGWYEGEVIFFDYPFYRVFYCDGDEEDMSQEEVEYMVTHHGLQGYV